MSMERASFRKNNQGVSVVVGALMLIIIVVTAAAALAVMVSEMQKEEMERRSHIAAVENEALEILSVAGTKNSSSWSSLNVTITNLNVKDAYITAIGVNDRYATNYTADGSTFDIARRLMVPATRSKAITLNFTTDFATPLNIGDDEPITIGVFTSLLNNFDRTFMSPTPMVKIRIESEDLGVADRDVLVLDGSESFDDGTIVSWSWTLADASATTPQGNWSDWVNITSRNYSGKLVRAILNSSGPFRANLTVTDDSEMVGVSDYLVLPANLRFNPPTNLAATYTAPMITATVTDVEGEPVGGCVVNFLVEYDAHGNLSLSPWSATTNGAGTATTTVTAGNGTIRVVSGKLPYIEIPV